MDVCDLTMLERNDTIWLEIAALIWKCCSLLRCFPVFTFDIYYEIFILNIISESLTSNTVPVKYYIFVI